MVPRKPVKCPECGSTHIWKDGLRKTRNGDVQRYLCRSCGYRFSGFKQNRVPQLQIKKYVTFQPFKKLHSRPDFAQIPIRHSDSTTKKALNDSSFSICEDVRSHNDPAKSTVGKTINAFASTIVNAKVCVSEGEAKNLVKVESRIEKRAAGATKPDSLTIKGLITQYAYWLEKEGYTSSEYLNLVKRLARLGANLLDPEDVKKTIGKQLWKNGSKMLAVYAYDAMAKMMKIEWSPPRYIQEENLPFVPEETELDQLVAGCRSRRMAVFLQTLKETFADPGEVLRLRWIDISGSIITINDPVKRHNPRQLKVSNKLITMLNTLPRTSERIFPTTYDSIQCCFVRVRKRVARILQNPRINAISFKTFRHWGATMTFHYTKNLLLVQKLLGHKSIKNTVKYTHMVHFKDDEFDVATATTVEEAKELAATGFEYFTTMNGIQIFRKPKMFQKYRY